MDDSNFNILLAHLERGWALVPLHDVSAGHCSCLAGVNCGRSAGKHPRYPRWQEDNQLVRDRMVLEAIHLAHPEWNWGAATGRVSGMWVLDWDQDHDLSIRHWLEQRIEGDFDDLYVPPDLGTLVLGPTGGGGWHYVFALPPDFEVKGSQTRNRYGLPPGLDVRGWHGQIVVAPSVSAKGPYGGVLIDAPIRRAPAWLEEMLRPQPGDNAVDGAIRGASSGVEAAQVGAGDPRAMAYAAAAVRDLLAELESAPVGTRNDTAFRVAARLIELGNAPWTGYTVDVLRDAWWQSAAVHPDGAHVPAAELLHVWRSASARIGVKAAELPIGYAGGETIPILGVMPDFPAAPLVAGAPALEATSSGGPTAGADLPFSDPAAMAPVDPSADPVTALIDMMYTPEGLAELPPPRPLVDGLLDMNTCAWIIGKPGCGKSFVTIDLAAHIGLGLVWQGRPVHRGRVVVMVGEGASGIRLRVDAWNREYAPLHGAMKDVLFLPMAIPVNERTGRYGAAVAGAWSIFVEACRRLEPVLVIIDTQARVTAGLNENDSGDMGYYVEQADRIRKATGACVLSVHHQGRTGQNARGSSAIDGAQDSEIRVERTGMILTLHVDKQKDQAESAPTTVALRRSNGGIDPATGRDLSSLVLARAPEPGELVFQDPDDTMPSWQRRMVALYKIIVDRFNEGDGGTKAEIRKAFQALPEIAALRSADGRDKAWARAWNGTASAPGLIARGLIAQKAGAARFKVVEVEDQSSEGVLTPNDLRNPTLPPEGWNLYLKDESPRA
jgi:hypothetical protein